MLDKIAELIRDYIGNDDIEITRDTDLMMDLGIASIDVLNLVADFEDYFEVKVDDKAISGFITVGDINDYIEDLLNTK